MSNPFLNKDRIIENEYESAMKEEIKPELETKKIRISFLKKGGK